MSNNDRGAVRTSQLDPVVDVIALTPRTPLVTFAEMWYQVFLWALFSSVLVHGIAAIIAFATLRKHHLGKFFAGFVIVVGVMGSVCSGSLSSAAIAFVYRASSLQMTTWHAMIWGVGQTFLAAAVGFTRVLATL